MIVERVSRGALRKPQAPAKRGDLVLLEVEGYTGKADGSREKRLALARVRNATRDGWVTGWELPKAGVTRKPRAGVTYPATLIPSASVDLDAAWAAAAVPGAVDEWGDLAEVRAWIAPFLTDAGRARYEKKIEAEAARSTLDKRPE